jgi:WD40 repeat protein
MAIGASDHSIYFLDVETLELKNRIEKAHDNSVFSLQYSPDEKHLISGGRDAMMNVWNLENDFAKISSQPAHFFTINSMAFHPDGHVFATGSRDKTIKIWDAENYQLIKVLELNRDGGHLNSVNCLLWHPHQNTLISCSDDRTIILWNAAPIS